MAARARLFLEDLDQKFDHPGCVADVLTALGLKLLEDMTGPDAISLCRIVVAEIWRNPELGSIFLAYGPDRVQARLIDFLEAANLRGELACADPASAARVFLGSVMATYHLTQLVLEKPPMIPPARVRAHVDEVVATFLCRNAAPV